MKHPLRTFWLEGDFNQKVGFGTGLIWLVLACFVPALFAGIPLQRRSPRQFKAESSAMGVAKNICVTNDSLTMVAFRSPLQPGHFVGDVYKVQCIPSRCDDTKLSPIRWQYVRYGRALPDTSRVEYFDAVGWRIARVFDFQ